MKTKLLLISLIVVVLTALGIETSEAATYMVTNFNDSGPGSLRDAIMMANSNPGPDTIMFNTGPGTINLMSPLPAITDTVEIIAGSSPTVELNGSGTQSAGSASIGFYIRAGNCKIQGFIINRFGAAGIRMDTDGSGNDNGNIIVGNYIGTNSAGNSSSCGSTLCGNVNRGILIVGTTGHLIGDGTTAGRNVISANQGNGIEITGNGSAIIRGNFIGTDASGNTDLGNARNGILIANSSNSTIGGLNSGDRNVISGNDTNGIAIIADFGFTASNNIVIGNYIGVTASGNAALRNNGSGVVIQASNNQVGGSNIGARNVISGNGTNGVSISTSLAFGNAVQGNFIGVGADGSTALGNTSNGIQISDNATNNLIGNTSTTAGGCSNGCNVIANNGAINSTTTAGAGIYIDPTALRGNQVRGNSIFNNGGLGIDLATPGSLANDNCDPDTGPNNLQNKPNINVATPSLITGSLNSLPNTTFVIEFFANLTTDGLNSEARTFIGSVQTTTNGSCTANFSFVPNSGLLTTGQYVTATATLANAPFDSSEISDPVIVTAPTASTAPLGGRILTAQGRPLTRILVYLINLDTGERETVFSDRKGFYLFPNVETGKSYVIRPEADGYSFDPSEIFVNHLEAREDLNFTATRPKKRP